MDDQVTLEDLKKAPKENPPPEAPAPYGQDPFTGKDGKLEQHLGRIGRFIGGGPEKAGNIAYIIVAASLVLLVIGGLAEAFAQSEKIASVFDRVITGSLSLITGAMGYLFGSADKHK